MIKLYRAKEAAAILRVHPITLKRWADKKEIPFIWGTVRNQKMRLYDIYGILGGDEV